MIRLATHADIPFIVEGMLDLKASTGWSAYVQPGYNQASLTTFVTERLFDTQSVLYVSVNRAGQPQGFCGGSLNAFYLPPHMPLVFEWGWFGPPKACTACWQAVVQWGRRHGAELAFCSQSSPTRFTRKIIEHQTWRVL